MRLPKLLPVILIGLTACARSGELNSGIDRVGPTAYGTINGGGGVGIRCDGKLEMLDVYEARQAGRQPLPPPKSEAQAVELVATKFAEHFWNIETIPKNEYIKLASDKIIQPIFEGRPFMNFETEKEEAVKFVGSLPLSNDFGRYQIPSKCRLEQIAYFSDSKLGLSIVKAKFDELDWLSKSVLVGHELAYWMDRREGLGKLRIPKVRYTSEDSRRFIGFLFTVESLPPKTAQMPPADQVYRCHHSNNVPKGTETYAYAFERPGSKTMSLVFNQIQGASSFYQVRADFPKLTLEKFLNTEGDDLQDTAHLVLNSAENNSTGLSRTGFSLTITKKKGEAASLVMTDISLLKNRMVGKPQPFSCVKYR